MTVTLNTDMRVGGLQETITVTGETPVVDVQNSTRDQRVLSDEVVAALPASRGYGNLLATVSGIQANGIQNSGIAPDMIFFTSRGGRSNEGTVQIDGMNVGSAFNGGGVAGYGYDTRAQEVQVTVAGGLGEADRGGPQFNLIPKTGGNKFSGTFFGNMAGKWSQGNNVDDQLKSFGIPSPAAIIRSWDTSFAMGGPIKRDKVWFYGITRMFGAYTDIAGRFGNAQCGRPDPLGLRPRSEHQAALGHQPEDRRRPRDRAAHADGTMSAATTTIRRSARAAPTRKDAKQCRVRGDDWMAVGGFGTWSPESTHSRDNAEHIMQFIHRAGDQQAAARSGVSQFFSNWGGQTPAGALDRRRSSRCWHRASASDQPGVPTGLPVANMLYHGFAGLSNNHQTHNVWRAAASATSPVPTA